jgi:hypothetical protein
VWNKGGTSAAFARSGFNEPKPERLPFKTSRRNDVEHRVEGVEQGEQLADLLILSAPNGACAPPISNLVKSFLLMVSVASGFASVTPSA